MKKKFKDVKIKENLTDRHMLVFRINEKYLYLKRFLTMQEIENFFKPFGKFYS